MNVSQNTIAKIECGLRSPSMDFVIGLVEYFETTLDYMLLGILAEDAERKNIDKVVDKIDEMIEKLMEEKERLLQRRKTG